MPKARGKVVGGVRIAVSSDLQNEIDRRALTGAHPVSVARMQSALARLGYRMDRRMDCHSVNRYMTGPCAGESYPAINAYVVESDTGIGFANVLSRRDANFKALQALRLDRLFAVIRGSILEI